MATINEDISWMLEAQQRFLDINRRIGEMVPDNGDRYDDMLVAHDASAQAVSGCERTVHYLRKAIEGAMGEG